MNVSQSEDSIPNFQINLVAPAVMSSPCFQFSSPPSWIVFDVRLFAIIVKLRSSIPPLLSALSACQLSSFERRKIARARTCSSTAPTVGDGRNKELVCCFAASPRCAESRFFWMEVEWKRELKWPPGRLAPSLWLDIVPEPGKFSKSD